MSNIAVKVENITKEFRIYSRPFDMLREMVTRVPMGQVFRALSNVSFEVKKGEVFGIIGRNGAGKSTLLKIIAKTLEKTSGDIIVNGSVSAILELGAGFNPEYTGRENIYMGGLCMGMTHKEIDGKVEGIIEFTELERVIDQPFKTYSTGMQARLTFSTALSVEPDILIIDEALSVGDAKFQHKCYTLMEGMRKSGRTILFVSHDTNSVNHFCSRALLLSEGEVIEQGKPKHVTSVYFKLMFDSDGEKQMEALEEEKPDAPVRQRNSKDAELERMALKEKVLEMIEVHDMGSSDMGNKSAEFIDFGVLDSKGKKTTILDSGERYTLYSKVIFFEDVDNVLLGVKIRNAKGVDLFVINSNRMKAKIPPQKKGNVLESRIEVTIWFAPGDYFLGFGAVDLTDSIEVLDGWADSVHIRVVGDENLDADSVVNLQPVWETHFLNTF